MSKVSDNNAFVKTLFSWYSINKRDLPWRNTNDPYKIWLSEIILQQTRVAQGLSYYVKFIEQYPTISDLALAEEDEVLRLWQGLGYYSRARNLHAAAKFVHHELEAQFPNTYDEIIQLKGVGTYTAAAISSFAFGESKAVVDGNVYRVLSRVFGITEDISSTIGIKTFAKKAQELIPEKQAGKYNQAIMEFGALHCIPKKPDCKNCPIKFNCEAKNLNLVEKLPVKLKKTKSKNRFFNYLIIEWQGKVILKKRGEGDIWQGLYEFPLVESNQEIREIHEFLHEFKYLKTENLYSKSEMPKHILSHQKIYSVFWRFKIETLPEGFKKEDFYNYSEVDDLPKPVLINNYLKGFIF